MEGAPRLIARPPWPQTCFRAVRRFLQGACVSRAVRDSSRSAASSSRWRCIRSCSAFSCAIWPSHVAKRRSRSAKCWSARAWRSSRSCRLLSRLASRASRCSRPSARWPSSSALRAVKEPSVSMRALSFSCSNLSQFASFSRSSSVFRSASRRAASRSAAPRSRAPSCAACAASCACSSRKAASRLPVASSRAEMELTCCESLI
mmetsp:Transcript_41246/g.111469  ORF Transcript_41246/g.111469 Transcript_41246/m.111469 type:complete len:204 (-) Transcript_41246:63-674(-)